MSALSDNLKKLMWQGRLNETELARQVCISQPVIHRLAKGETTNPNVDTLRPIAKFFDISLEQLIGDEPLPLDKPQQGSASLDKWRDIPEISWEEALHWKHNDKPYALRVLDNTMEPRFLPNTLLIVDPTLTPNNGDFVVVNFPDQSIALFKQILFDGQDVYLKSLNSDFQIIKSESNHSFLGVVVEARFDCRIKS